MQETYYASSNNRRGAVPGPPIITLNDSGPHVRVWHAQHNPQPAHREPYRPPPRHNQENVKAAPSTYATGARSLSVMHASVLANLSQHAGDVSVPATARNDHTGGPAEDGKLGSHKHAALTAGISERRILGVIQATESHRSRPPYDLKMDTEAYASHPEDAYEVKPLRPRAPAYGAGHIGSSSSDLELSIVERDFAKLVFPPDIWSLTESELLVRPISTSPDVPEALQRNNALYELRAELDQHLEAAQSLSETEETQTVDAARKTLSQAIDVLQTVVRDCMPRAREDFVKRLPAPGALLSRTESSTLIDATTLRLAGVAGLNLYGQTVTFPCSALRSSEHQNVILRISHTVSECKPVPGEHIAFHTPSARFLGEIDALRSAGESFQLFAEVPQRCIGEPGVAYLGQYIAIQTPQKLNLQLAEWLELPDKDALSDRIGTEWLVSNAFFKRVPAPSFRLVAAAREALDSGSVKLPFVVLANVGFDEEYVKAMVSKVFMRSVSTIPMGAWSEPGRVVIR